MAQRRQRVFLGTLEIAGFYSRLAAALREAGADCTFVELVPHPFDYEEPAAGLPRFVGWARRLAGLRQRLMGRASPPRARILALYAAETAIRTLLILPWAAGRYDVFCFGFGSRIVGNGGTYWDVALLRLLRKRIVFMFHGADSRPPYLTGPYVRLLRARSSEWPRNLRDLTRRRKHAVAIMNRLADVVIDVPVRGHFHERRFVDFAHLGPPRTDEGEASRPQAADPERPVRILHAPSDRAAKGSDVIAACVARLKASGHNIEYVEIHGLPHREVQRALQSCDFVIDQLYSDFPMAGFASEAAGYGKPAVVCGYLRDCRCLEQMPTHYCHPDELEGAVLRLVLDKEYRETLGARARQFVVTQWARTAVARRWRRVFEGDIPDQWWCDPGATGYLHGGGMDEGLLRDAVGALVASYGPAALQLDDKPGLRDELVRLAETGSG